MEWISCLSEVDALRPNWISDTVTDCEVIVLGCMVINRSIVSQENSHGIRALTVAMQFPFFIPLGNSHIASEPWHHKIGELEVLLQKTVERS